MTNDRMPKWRRELAEALLKGSQSYVRVHEVGRAHLTIEFPSTAAASAALAGLKAMAEEDAKARREDSQA